MMAIQHPVCRASRLRNAKQHHTGMLLCESGQSSVGSGVEPTYSKERRRRQMYQFLQ